MEGEATELGTFSTIGATSETGLTGITLSAVTHAEGAMYEDFQQCFRTSLVDGADFFQRQFARQDHLTESCFMEKLHLLNGTVVHLRTGMQGDRREVQHGDAHILHDEGIYPNAIELPNQSFGFFQFLVLQDGIQRDIDTHAEKMGIFHQLGNVFEGVGCRSAGTELRRPNIHGICSVIHGFNATFQVSGRGKQFYASHLLHRLLNVFDVVWGLLIYEVIQPVGKQQVGMCSPTHHYPLIGIVVTVVIVGHLNGKSFA